MHQKNKIYVFVRRDLSIPQVIVQACHAAIESQSPTQEKHPHLVLIGVKTEEKLKQAMDFVSNKDIKVLNLNSLFLEI